MALNENLLPRVSPWRREGACVCKEDFFHGRMIDPVYGDFTNMYSMKCRHDTSISANVFYDGLIPEMKKKRAGVSVKEVDLTPRVTHMQQLRATVDVVIV